MVLALLAFVTSIEFPGGSASDFVKQLAENSHQNVVVAQSTVAGLPKAAYDPADLNTMARTLRTKLDLQMAPGTELILNDGMLNPSRIGQIPDGLAPLPKWRALTVKEIQGGTVTVTTQDKERLDPSGLETAPFSKPVRVHWLFEGTPVAVSVTKMPEGDFLRYVAKSIGAKLTVTAQEYRMDLDPEEVRKRALKTIERWTPAWQAYDDEEKPLKSQVGMLRATLQEIRAADLVEALATPESQKEFLASSNGPVSRVLLESLQMYGKVDKETQSFTMRTPTGDLRLPEQWDSSKGLGITLFADFQTEVEFRLFSNRNVDSRFSFNFPRIGG